MLVARVEEQLRVLGLVDQFAGGVDVALADEDRVGVHSMHLHRYPSGQAEPNAETGTQE